MWQVSAPHSTERGGRCSVEEHWRDLPTPSPCKNKTLAIPPALPPQALWHAAALLHKSLCVVRLHVHDCDRVAVRRGRCETLPLWRQSAPVMLPSSATKVRSIPERRSRGQGESPKAPPTHSTAPVMWPSPPSASDTPLHNTPTSPFSVPPATVRMPPRVESPAPAEWVSFNLG